MKGTLLIDSSTINPDVAKEVASQAEEKGATYLDAPVSGGKNDMCSQYVIKQWPGTSYKQGV